jgi:hypothetical protein
MNNYRLMTWVSVGLLFPFFLRAQKLDSMMTVYADGYPQEKIHVQFDKKIYNPGETIWFKAYIFSGPDPSLVSKNFYAELSDESGNLLQRKTEPIVEATTAGNFELPANLKNGHVHFRAYTTWMTNFDTTFFYEKDIRIYNKKADSGLVVTRREARIQFFPEGGDLVAGVENSVAFKANDQFGLPVDVKGSLLDGTGKTILVFTSQHDGMGKFLVTPDKGDSLIAVWNDDKGIERRISLPVVKTTGAVLRVIAGTDKVLFSVARSAEGGPELKRFTIMAHMHQHLVYKARINLEDNFMSGGTVPTGQLPTGVLQLTLFNAMDVPVAERVVFVNNHEFEFSPVLSVLQKGIGRRGRNNLVLEVPDTLRADLSMAVTDAEADGALPGDDNIISRLLLTGDIKGYVHDPYYYFSNPSDSLRAQLDLVMMTHGWRRFKWDQLALGKVPVIKTPVENYLSLKVEVLGVDPFRISKDESLNVILSKKDSSSQMIAVPHLTGTKFGITGLVFYDTARAYYQFNVNRKLSNEAAISFNNGLLKGSKTIKPLTRAYDGWTHEDSLFFRRNQAIKDEAARVKPFEDQKVKTLETVTVHARQKTDAEKLDEKYTSGLFSGGDGTTFDVNDDPYAASMIDVFTYLQGKVAGLQIITGQGAPSLTWRGGTPTLYLNEMQVDAQQLQSTNINDIAMVKVFRPGSGVGTGGGAGGVISVYTKKGDERRASDDANSGFKGLEHAQVLGYSPMRQFYVPDYDLQNSPVEKEDLRTTLYWKPFLLTDKDNRRIEIHFYNNDISHKLRIIMEGINENGKLCHLEKILQ